MAQSPIATWPHAVYGVGMYEGLAEADEAEPSAEVSKARPLVAPEPERWLSEGQELVVRCALVLGVTVLVLWLLGPLLEPAPWP